MLFFNKKYSRTFSFAFDPPKILRQAIKGNKIDQIAPKNEVLFDKS